MAPKHDSTTIQLATVLYIPLVKKFCVTMKVQKNKN